MKKGFLILNLLLIAAVCVGNYFYFTVGGLTVKALCSGGFALLGCVNLVYALLNRKRKLLLPVMMALGFVLAMLGDICISDAFFLGAGLFAAGHVCFAAAGYVWKKPRWQDLLISAILFAGAAAFLLLCPLLQFSDPLMKWVCIAYALIISVMTGKAVSNFLSEPGLPTGLMALGSVLFFFSDLMLVFDWFIGRWDWAGTLCMSTYYPAQCLLAHTVYRYVTGAQE